MSMHYIGLQMEIYWQLKSKSLTLTEQESQINLWLFRAGSIILNEM